jgi:PiT family inorganic phosphate transporter
MDFQAMGADGETHYWYDIVGWYKASKDGGTIWCLIIITFIVLLH